MRNLQITNTREELKLLFEHAKTYLGSFHGKKSHTKSVGTSFKKCVNTFLTLLLGRISNRDLCAIDKKPIRNGSKNNNDSCLHTQTWLK